MSKIKGTLVVAAVTAAFATAIAPSPVWGQKLEVCPGPADATACIIDNFKTGEGRLGPLTTSPNNNVNQPVLPATGAGLWAEPAPSASAF